MWLTDLARDTNGNSGRSLFIYVHRGRLVSRLRDSEATHLATATLPPASATTPSPAGCCPTRRPHFPGRPRSSDAPSRCPGRTGSYRTSRRPGRIGRGRCCASSRSARPCPGRRRRRRRRARSPGSLHSFQVRLPGRSGRRWPEFHSLTQIRPCESDHTRRAPWSGVGGSMTVALPVLAYRCARCGCRRARRNTPRRPAWCDAVGAAAARASNTLICRRWRIEAAVEAVLAGEPEPADRRWRC